MDIVLALVSVGAQMRHSTDETCMSFAIPCQADLREEEWGSLPEVTMDVVSCT